MNLDTLVSIGQPPWQPTPAASDVDVWDKYDFPICGTYCLGDDLVIFTILTTAGTRSLWAYVPVPPADQESVVNARFDSEAEFDRFLRGRFASRETVFAAAENFKITSKSDGIRIPPGRNALLATGARWYVARASALTGQPRRKINDTDTKALLRETQGALATLPT